MRERHQVSSTLSARVIEYLRQKYTQAEIARMLHVSEPFVSLVKNRERSLTIDHLELLANSMSVPLGAMLMVMTEPKNPSKEVRKSRAALAQIMELSDKAREAILQGPGKRKASA